MAEAARTASRIIAAASTAQKNSAILEISRLLKMDSVELQSANATDLEYAKRKNVAKPLQDRLHMDQKEIDRMCAAAESVAALPDPIGVVSDLRQQPSGIKVGQMRIPVGVLGMIYESRPNVTLEAASLSIKSGNAILLKGGSEAINTNCAIADRIEQALHNVGLPRTVVQLLRTTDRQAVSDMLAADEFIDLIVPRGGKSLIERVSQESSIPVLKHLDGVCHVYIDDSADETMAIAIAVNSKAEKYAVCNAAETLLIQKNIAPKVLPRISKDFRKVGVEVRACERCLRIVPDLVEAQEDDWSTEYLDAVISVKIVDDLDEAISHIQDYGSGHTDTIVANNLDRTQRFVTEVDSASVMVNTSTQFADGFEYGLGAEIGISTDKLHARGPVGLAGLTTQKFVVYSDGAIRHR